MGWHSVLLFMIVNCSMWTTAVAAGVPQRISALSVNQGKVQRVLLTPGLASVVLFPCEIDEAIIGRSEDLKATVSPTTKRNLILHLARGVSLATNLIVRCGNEELPFVFDIVPSKTNHQDLVRVAEKFGGPELPSERMLQRLREERERQRVDEELRAIIKRTK